VARGAFRADGDEYRKRAHRQTRLATLQIIEPNQPEAQSAVHVRGIFASADRGDGLIAAA
jgi:hypothetical protein